MESNRSQFGLPHLAIILATAPVILFTTGLDNVVKAGQHPGTQKSQEASWESEINRLQLDLQLESPINVEIRNLLLNGKSTDETLSEAQPPEPTEEPITYTFTATAYCVKNITACGVMVRRGIIAADPNVLPFGSIVRIEAGKYSGVYHVLDTGPRVRGKRLDIYIPCRSDAIHFGRQKVQIEVVRYGWGNEDDQEIAEEEQEQK